MKSRALFDSLLEKTADLVATAHRQRFLKTAVSHFPFVTFNVRTIADEVAIAIRQGDIELAQALLQNAVELESLAAEVEQERTRLRKQEERVYSETINASLSAMPTYLEDGDPRLDELRELFPTMEIRWLAEEDPPGPIEGSVP